RQTRCGPSVDFESRDIFVRRIEVCMSTPGCPPLLARFDAFEVDFRAGELYKAGRKIKLQVQPLQVLAMLLERPGEVVTREELKQRLWPVDTFVDFDHSLNTAIKKVRQVLDDDAKKPRFIETLARRGYRFIDTVEEVAARPQPAKVPASPLIGRLARLRGEN